MKLPYPAVLLAAPLLAATVLLGSSSGCGDAVEENKDLQMDRRQVDTYGDETPIPSADEAAADPAAGATSEPAGGEG